MAVHRQHLVPRLQTAGGAAGVFADKIIDHAACDGPAEAQQHNEHEIPQHEIHRRAGKDHKKALPRPGFVEIFAADHRGQRRRASGARTRRWLRAFLLIAVFPRHGIVAAQRQQANAVPCPVFDARPDSRAKADGKLLHMDAAPARRQEMPQLVHQHDRAKHQNCRNHREKGCEHRHLVPAHAGKGARGS